MDDWKILNETYVKNDYELMGDIFYKHNSDKLALKCYTKAFNYAKEMAQLIEQELQDPFNTPSMQEVIKDVYVKYEKTCERVIKKIKNI